MQYWWVNQNQTGPQEWAGGYMWSPKRNRGGARNPFYEFMREVVPGELILAFARTRIQKIGVARSFAYSCPKPPEFGNAGPNWERIGWKVDVHWIDLDNAIRPAEHLDRLLPHFPARYAPLQHDGRGKQSIYLTRLPAPLMEALVDLIGHQARTLMRLNRQFDQEPFDPIGPEQYQWEEHLREEVEKDPAVAPTQKREIILARRGQGMFRSRVAGFERACRVTKVDRLEYLRASHIKPWRDADNAERLDGENGLLLTPSIDHLFDRGFISFEDSGELILSPAADLLSLERMSLPREGRLNVGGFREAQRRYLRHHRDEILLKARLAPE